MARDSEPDGEFVCSAILFLVQEQAGATANCDFERPGEGSLISQVRTASTATA